jgi:hypothetical protein
MKISQREARRLKKRVEELENRAYRNNRHWSSEYPGGVHIDTIRVTNAEACIIETAIKLGHAVIVKSAGNDQIHVYGVKP